MTVVVTGSSGQLGRALVEVFDRDGVVGLTRESLDVGDEAAVFDVLTALAPSLVVNAAAFTDVDACETDPVRAHRVNAIGPWWLARACDHVGAALVTISTDYVFGAGGARPPGPPDVHGRPRGWSEFDRTDPCNVYGRSKAAGEELVRRTIGAHHIVRTAWLTGASGHGFVHTMLDRAGSTATLRVVDDQFGSPTFTGDLAVAVRELAVAGRYGTWHRTNRGVCSWYELAVATFDRAGRDVEVVPVGSAEFPRAAPRPGWSVLDDTHATQSGLAAMPTWQDGLDRMLAALGHRGGPDVTGGSA